MGFLDAAYGKYGKDGEKTQVIMEYNKMFPYMTDYLPKDLRKDKGFKNWLKRPDIMERYASMLMMTLPGDRLSYYQTTDVAKMRESIYKYTNKITQSLGFFPIEANTALVSDM